MGVSCLLVPLAGKNFNKGGIGGPNVPKILALPKLGWPSVYCGKIVKKNPCIGQPSPPSLTFVKTQKLEGGGVLNLPPLPRTGLKALQREHKKDFLFCIAQRGWVAVGLVCRYLERPEPKDRTPGHLGPVKRFDKNCANDMAWNCALKVWDEGAHWPLRVPNLANLCHPWGAPSQGALLLLILDLKVLPAIFILVLNFLMADRFYKVVQKPGMENVLFSLGKIHVFFCSEKRDDTRSVH